MPRKKISSQVRTLPTRSRDVVVGSSFLGLPPELRNAIYEYAVQDVTTISFKKRQVLYDPPLSLVCKQIRREFEEIFLNEAPKYATEVLIHITNFYYTDITPTWRSLPPLVSGIDPSLCTLTVVAHLNNMFDSSLHHLRGILWNANHSGSPPSDRPIPPTTAYKVVVDSKSFDVNYFKQMLPKLQWVHGRHGITTSRGNWPRMLAAFNEAMHVCEFDRAQLRKRRQSAATQSSGKRRKTNTGRP